MNIWLHMQKVEAFYDYVQQSYADVALNKINSLSVPVSAQCYNNQTLNIFIGIWANLWEPLVNFEPGNIVSETKGKLASFLLNAFVFIVLRDNRASGSANDANKLSVRQRLNYFIDGRTVSIPLGHSNGYASQIVQSRQKQAILPTTSRKKRRISR